jgi:putative spermidine/putrescine transport system substrate-binding protein
VEMKKQLGVLLGLVAALLVVAGLPASAASTKNEGKISILAWPGYAEDGSVDKTQNWVKPFEKQTGCKATVKTFGTSDEAFTLFDTGQYDVVSFSGDASLRGIVNGDVAPLKVSRLKNYADIAPFLKDAVQNSYKGKVYGIPHGWGANLLVTNDDKVQPHPTSWGVIFDKSSPYSGEVTVPDNPIYIADAALYLSKTQPDLGITNPYALDQKQFDAAVNLLKQQKGIVGEYWSDALKQEEAFLKQSAVVGSTWQYQVNLAEDEKGAPPLTTQIPDEGATAWSDNWFIAKNTKHPNCSYAWLNYITTPKVQAQVAEWFGEAPANLKACDDTQNTDHCTDYHADDPSFYNRLSYWITPTAKCLDGRTGVKCVAYKDWLAAWDEIKAS